MPLLIKLNKQFSVQLDPLKLIFELEILFTIALMRKILAFFLIRSSLNLI